MRRCPSTVITVPPVSKKSAFVAMARLLQQDCELAYAAGLYKVSGSLPASSSAEIMHSCSRIDRVEIIPVGLPLSKPLFMGGRRYDRSESLIVRVRSVEGVDGWGEAAPFLGSGECLSDLVATARELVGAVEGCPVSERRGLLTRINRGRIISSRVLSAFDTALADLFA